jgi:hypothetical protein
MISPNRLPSHSLHKPGVVDHKYYVKGIGQVSETTVKGPKEASLLVSYK